MHGPKNKKVDYCRYGSVCVCVRARACECYKP